VYPLLLRDAAWWGLDEAVVRRRLPGMRSALEMALATCDAGGLPEGLPGWLFVDWVDHPGWELGAPAGQAEAVTAPVALHLPMALDAAAELEEAVGDPLLAQRWRRSSAEVMAGILKLFYSEAEGCLADNREHSCFSEHSQALALASDSLPDELREPLTLRLLNPPDGWARASVYFSIHVHEALLRGGHADAVAQRFDFWKRLSAQGFVSTVERPEPSRSDCHGWGAHPLYHCLSGFAGIRPDAAGFQRVRISPCPGSLKHMVARLPHPDGFVSLDVKVGLHEVTVQVQSPVPGHFCWGGEEIGFEPGRHRWNVLLKPETEVEDE
jgi:hypothetical protein